jgi:hypothetical protein
MNVSVGYSRGSPALQVVCVYSTKSETVVLLEQGSRQHVGQMFMSHSVPRQILPVGQN